MPVQKKKNNIAKTTSIMEKNAKIYIAGHHGLVGSAIWKNLQEKGYTNLIGKTHKELDLLDGVAVRRLFDEEQPEYVFLAAAFVGGIMANSIYRADFIYKNLHFNTPNHMFFCSLLSFLVIVCRIDDLGRFVTRGQCAHSHPRDGIDPIISSQSR